MYDHIHKNDHLLWSTAHKQLNLLYLVLSKQQLKLEKSEDVIHNINLFSGMY